MCNIHWKLNRFILQILAIAAVFFGIFSIFPFFMISTLPFFKILPFFSCSILLFFSTGVLSRSTLRSADEALLT